MIPEFTYPAVLWLLLLLPPLIVWWRWQRRGSLRHPAAAALVPLPVARSRLAVWGGALLRALALAAFILAVAGPRWPDEKTRIATEGIAIELVVDVSSSSGDEDYEWEGRPVSRLEAVKRVFRLFVLGGAGPDGAPLEGRPMDRIGLVTFTNLPDNACPLTLSHNVLVQILERQESRSTETTNVSDAILLGLHRLKKAGPGRKVLLLLSDGQHNVPSDPTAAAGQRTASGMEPHQAAQIAANLDIPIYTIDPAPEQPRPGGLSANSSPEERADGIRRLRQIAQITGGEYFRADNTAGLMKACRDIDAKERQRIESFQYRRYHEGFPWFALSGFAVLALTLVLERTVWRRLPG